MKFFLAFILLLFYQLGQAQQTEKIKIFMDCWCPMDFIKREITIVDFVLDNKAADVHILITSRNTGGGGEEAQIIFYGQNRYSSIKDTLLYVNPPNTTDFVQREELLKYLKIGLLPFIARTEAVKQVTVNFKKPDENKTSSVQQPTNDKWNYWVFNVGVNGFLNGDKVYKSTNFNGNASANRITDKLKLTFSLNLGKTKNTFTIEDPSGGSPPLYFETNNQVRNVNHQMVKSITSRWSAGYNINVQKNTFSNYDLRTVINPAVEYNIFPYSESNNKLLTIRYGPDLTFNNYIDSTIYFKTNETLLGQGLNINLSLTQKWGSSSVGVHFHNYFMNQWKYFNMGLNGNINVRITGGLSFNAGFYGGLVRDQLNISGKDASQQDILIKRRQVASNYNYFTHFGISYRFGSKLNNFVNPRFEGGGPSMIFF